MGEIASMDKAVILARGLGTRMRQEAPGTALSSGQERVAASGVKALMPVGRPFLDYVLTALADAGYRRVCLVIGPEHQALRNYYGETLACTRLELGFAIQEEPRGTADAVAAAEEFAGEDPFLVINSDNYYPVEAMQALRGLEGPGLAVFDRESMVAHSNIPAARLLKFAVVEVGHDNRMKRIIEKPDPEVVRKLSGPIGISMNCWRFDPIIFSACRAISPSSRGELEITDAVQYAVDQLGQPFQVLPFAAPVLDLSSREDIGPVSARLLHTEVRL